MRQHSVIAFAGILALLMGGCTIGEDETVAPSPSQPPTPVAAAPASPATPSATASPTAQPNSAAQQKFDKPTVPPRAATTPAVAGLLPSTNSDVRIRQIQKGRQDPFAVVPIQPRVIVTQTGTDQFQPPAAVNPRPIPPLPGVSPSNRNRLRDLRGGQVGAGRGNISTPGRTPISRGARPGIGQGARSGASQRNTPNRLNRPNRPGTGQQIATRPNNAPGLPPALPFRPTLPPLPEPTLAQSVEVSGVVQVGGVAQAIVKAPNEPNSRYVRAGERLSNGQVLVKRIDMNEGPNPIVVLEQYGREVEKRIGEKSAPTAEQGQQASVASDPKV